MSYHVGTCTGKKNWEYEPFGRQEKQFTEQQPCIFLGSIATVGMEMLPLTVSILFAHHHSFTQPLPPLKEFGLQAD